MLWISVALIGGIASAAATSRLKLLFERRGGDAAELVSAIHEAALSYPHQNECTMWPGPNSNSFTAWIGLRVPELGLQLPAKAIGKSWMQNNLPDS